MVHVAVGVVSRVHGTSRSLRQRLGCEWSPALGSVIGTVRECSVVNEKGCVNDAKEQAAAE
jgi:hypothetical protein